MSCGILANKGNAYGVTEDQSFRFSTAESDVATDCSLRLGLERIGDHRQLLLLRLLQLELLGALSAFRDARGRSCTRSGRSDGRGRDLSFFRFRRVCGEGRRGGSGGLPPEVGKEMIHAGQRTQRREIQHKRAEMKNKDSKKVDLVSFAPTAHFDRTTRRSTFVLVFLRLDMHGYIDSIAIPLHLPQSVLSAKSTAKGKGKEREVVAEPQYDVVKSWTAQERDQVERKVSMASLRSSQRSFSSSHRADSYAQSAIPRSFSLSPSRPTLTPPSSPFRPRSSPLSTPEQPSKGPRDSYYNSGGSR